MSDHLRFFALEKSPFEGEGQTQVVLGTRAMRDAFAAKQSGLSDGSSRICVSGESGLGKTSLARALPKLLGDGFRVALVSDPSRSWDSLRDGIARPWGIEEGGLARPRVLEAASRARRVLVIDQAERVSEEFLDHLDVVLCYRTPEKAPAVQSVLLARLSTAPGETPSPLLWWLDRLQTLQLDFAPIPLEGVPSYIEKHLRRAGWRGEQLFEDDAAHAIHASCDGVPGRISDLCEALLVAAAQTGRRTIDGAFVRDFEQGRIPPAAPEEDDSWALDETIKLDDEIAPIDAPSPSEPAPPVDELLPHELAERADETFRAEPADLSHEPFRAEPADRVDEPCQPEPRSRAADPYSPEPSGAADPLDAPPSPEELRAILGGGLRRHLALAAGLLALVLVGGLAMAFLSTDDGGSQTDPTRIGDVDRTAARTPERVSTHTGGLAQKTSGDESEAPPVLFIPGGFVVPDEADGSPTGSPTTRQEVPAATPSAIGGPPAAPAPTAPATRQNR